MTGFVISFLIGVTCIVLGVANRRGNISSLHSYHTHRVSQEDRLPFGKKVGLGTIIIGCAIAVYSGLDALAVYTEKRVFVLVGTGLLIAGLVVGLGISFYAIQKYNKGIF